MSEQEVRLAVVGSVSLQGSARAAQIIGEVFDRYQPTVFVSGGAPGIDKMAEEEAKRRGMPDDARHVYPPKTHRWLDGFRPRNLLIADDCTHLVRIVATNSKTYGSGWTRDRAKERGVKCEEYRICGICKGTGTDPLSDNVNSLPCNACKGNPVEYEHV